MSAKKIHRVPILVALIAVVVAAIVFDNRESSSQASAVRAEGAAADASVPSEDSLSTSWYCAEGTSTPDGRADETVLIASVADTASEATVTVMPGGEAAPVSRTVRLDPREEKRVRVADVLATPEPAVVVEVVGGQAVVAHELVANGDLATEPCARGAASDWYFADGTTLKGAQQYLVLFDPFGDDAIVDISLVTDDGVQEPDALQAISVPRRSRVTIPVSDLVPRQRSVAVHVHARTGRVVAERTQIFDGTASDGEVVRQGIAVSMGALSPRHEWYFPYGTTEEGAIGEIAIANFGGVVDHRRSERHPRRRPVARPAADRHPGPLGHDRRRRLARPGRSAVCGHGDRARRRGRLRVPSWPRCSRPGRRRRRVRVSPPRSGPRAWPNVG